MSVFSKTAWDAVKIAKSVGFVPDHMVIHNDGVRRECLVSGTDENGFVYQIEFSVTDPDKMKSPLRG